MAIQFVKMLDGDDVVAEVEKIGDTYVLHSPAKLMITQQGLGMMPMNPFVTDKKITVPASFVIYTATLEDEIRNAYNEKFGSGIIVAPSVRLHV
jgi:hypothetical protein